MDQAIDSPRSYRLAGRRIVADFTFPALAPFAEEGAAVWPSELAGAGREELRRELYRGPGEVGEVSVEVECIETPACFVLAVAGVGRFRIARDGSAVRLEEVAPGVDPERLAQTAVGPPLLLALALGGSFCLHASAVRGRSGAVAFLGASGSGKSTLVGYLRRAGAGCERLADDVVALAAERPGALSGAFPQAELSPAGPASAAEADLAAVYLLDAPPPAGGDGVEIARLSEREGALLLVRHTMAARLFPPAALERHTALCAALARRVPIARLAYPRRLDALPTVSLALERDGAIG